MLKTVEIDLEFAPIIAGPPVPPKQLYRQSASNDEVTIDSWRDVWIQNVRSNHKTHGPFGANGVGKLFNQYLNRSVIVVGSGPSLKLNVKELAQASKILPVISCLHNFHFMEDNGVKVEYYVSLDAGPITETEVYDCGKRTQEEYWELTRGKKLLAYIGSHPNLISKWRGEIIWFNCPIPDERVRAEVQAVEHFHTYVSTGGNVLGASFYLAKAIFGGNPIIFVGADFSFSYDKKFHGWNSNYDKDLGNVFKITDIFGNKRYTWNSYNNFKLWIEYAATSVPGIYINATEGGCLGAYPEGNIRQIIQMSLAEVVAMFTHQEHMRELCENPGMEITQEKQIKLLF